MKKVFLFLTTIVLLVSCGGNAQNKKEIAVSSKVETIQEKEYPVTKTDAEWKAQLTPQEYYVLRKKGTERPFTGKYNKYYGDGFYACAACGAKLYESKYKFNSGTGWPSFDRGNEEKLEYEIDKSFGTIRTEILCSDCGGHLGHVFNDGPRNTTGKRHCINSVSLQFVASNAPKE